MDSVSGVVKDDVVGDPVNTGLVVGVDSVLEKLSYEAGFKPQTVIEDDNPASILELVKLGIGFAVLPAAIDCFLNLMKNSSVDHDSCPMKVIGTHAVTLRTFPVHKVETKRGFGPATLSGKSRKKCRSASIAAARTQQSVFVQQ